MVGMPWDVYWYGIWATGISWCMLIFYVSQFVGTPHITDNYEPDDKLYHMWQAFRKKKTRRVYERIERYQNLFSETIEAITEKIGADQLEEWKQDGERHVIFWGNEGEPEEFNAAVEALVAEASQLGTPPSLQAANWVDDLLAAASLSADTLKRAFINFDELSGSDQQTVRKAAQAFAAVEAGLCAQRAQHPELQADMLAKLKPDADEYYDANSIGSTDRRRLVALSLNKSREEDMLAALVNDLGYKKAPSSVRDIVTNAAGNDPVETYQQFLREARREDMSAASQRATWEAIIKNAKQGKVASTGNTDTGGVAIGPLVQKAAATRLAGQQFTKFHNDHRARIAAHQEKLMEQLNGIQIWVVEDDFGLKKCEYPYQQKEVLEGWLAAKSPVIGDVLTGGTFDVAGAQQAAKDRETLWAAALNQLGKTHPTGTYKKEPAYEPFI